MSVRAVRLLLLSVVGVLLLPGQAGAASLALPGLRIEPPRHRLVTVMTAGGSTWLQVTPEAARRYHNRQLTWDCFGAGPLVDDGGGGGGERINASSLRLRVEQGSDACIVEIVVRTVRHRHRDGRKRTTRVTRRLRQPIAITSDGSALIARVRGALRLSWSVGAVYVGIDDRTGRLDSAASIVKDAHRFLPSLPLLALASADAPAPKGKVGVWTDGQHRYVVKLTLPDGAVLFYDKDMATGLLSRNVQDQFDALAYRYQRWFDDMMIDSSDRPS